jgi:plastocyanin
VPFTNGGKAMHTVTADDGSFNSGMMKAGTTWSRTFTTAGSFPYKCDLHPNMRGTIEVGGSGGGNQANNLSSGGGNGNAGKTSATTDTTGSTSATTSTTTAGAANATIQPVTVEVADNEFKPNPATVAVGGTVTWKWVGAVVHTVTADDQSFNSDVLKPGESFEHTFTTLGSFTYSCLIHPGMTGTIDVVPPDQAPTQGVAAATGGGQPPQAVDLTSASSAAPAKSSGTGLLGGTLLGIAAVLVGSCALLFALKSFLKVLSADSSGPVPPPHAIC